MQIPQETKLSDSFPTTTWGHHLISVSSVDVMEALRMWVLRAHRRLVKGARSVFLTPQT